MTLTFQPPKNPSRTGLRIEEKPNVSMVIFEGQYSQRAKTGPNPISRNVPLSFGKLSVTDRDAITGFLRAREGVESFHYTVPGDTTERLWTCPKWSSMPDRNKVLWSVQLTLKEEFDIV